ncbi:MAG: hypothetical protein V4534_08870 [Myxococcota bacterium]
MAILSGSITYTRFSVLANLPNSLAEYFEKALAIRRFVPLHEEGRDIESSGWVSIQNPYLDDERILNNQFMYGDLIVLGFREDKISIPKAMLRDLVSRRLQEFPDKNRQVVEAAVIAELRQRILPKSKVTEVLWDLSKGQVRLFARGKGMCEKFEKLFEQTFQAKLKQLTYPEIALSQQLSLKDKGYLETLMPQEIFT